MSKHSAGILVFRKTGSGVEILLVHPGGPFWAKKDLGAWTIPKGLVEEGEDFVAAAKREFEEETGFTLPQKELIPLGEIRQKSGKTVHAWAVEGDYDLSLLKSNLFSMEWPPKSGAHREFPEIDRSAYYRLSEARIKMNESQCEFIDRLLSNLGIVEERTPVQAELF